MKTGSPCTDAHKDFTTAIELAPLTAEAGLTVLAGKDEAPALSPENAVGRQGDTRLTQTMTDRSSISIRSFANPG